MSRLAFLSESENPHSVTIPGYKVEFPLLVIIETHIRILANPISHPRH
jgi:hypothetical protein